MAAAQATHTSTSVAEFVLVAEPSLGLDPVALENGRWTIGSTDDNRIVAPEPGISAQHCLILVVGDQLLLKSWSEHTRVNGSPQREGYLRDGDVLTLANTDFQIRRADSIGSDGEATEQSSSIVGQLQALSDIVEELDRELSGRQVEVDRLDKTIARIQTGLEQRATSEETITRLRSQIVELQQTAAASEAASPVQTAEAEVGEFEVDEAGQDLRIQAAQQNLDQIIDEFEEEELSLGDPGFERQLSLQVQHQLRQLESVSASLQGRAAVLEQQALELDGQRVRSGDWQTAAAQDSEDQHDGSWDGTDEGSVVEEVVSEEDPVSHDELASPSDVGTAPEESILPAAEATTEFDSEDAPAITEETADAPKADDDILHSYVAEQRAKLRELMEDFEPFQSAPEADEQEDQNETAESEIAETEVEEATVEGGFAEAEIRETVTASVLGGNSSLTEVVGARRSRDEAIRQLDELIRDANDESLSDVPIPKLPSGPSRGSSTIAGTDTVTEGETAWDGARVGSFEVDLEDESLEPGNADSLEQANVEDSIEATLDFATEQLEALSESAVGSVEGDTACKSEFETAGEFEVGETGTAIESSLTTDDAVDEQSNGECPSSFDWSASRFEEAEENQSADLEETAPEEPAQEESSTPDHRVDELRSQLAQMFDLPAGSSASGGPLQSTEDEATSPVVKESSLLTEALAADSTQPQTETGTQDARVEDTPGNSGADEATTATDSASVELDNPDSIGAYMEALLARNRKQTGDERPEFESEKEETASSTELVSERFLTQPTTDGESDEGDTLDRSWLTEGPKHKQDRDAVRASLTTLREVANHSARSAVAQASKTQLKQKILTLTGASLICLAFAIAAALFNVNPLLPLGAVGVSLFFAVKLGNEMRHSSAIMRHAKKAARESASSGEVRTPDEVIEQETP
jgi:pSer/pThr/pTyr-binding forkhead associated (FHA) protein